MYFFVASSILTYCYRSVSCKVYDK